MAASKNTKNVTRAAKEAAVSVVTLTAIVPVVYDGLRVNPGEHFEARVEDADQLLAVGAAILDEVEPA